MSPCSLTAAKVSTTAIRRLWLGSPMGGIGRARTVASSPAGATAFIRHVLDDNAAQHDVITLSALYLDPAQVQVDEAADGHEAILEVQASATSAQAPHWTALTALDGVKDGAPVDVLLSHPVALTELHANDWSV